MSFLNLIPWKMIARFTPVIMELIHDVKKEDCVIEELETRITQLEQSKKALEKYIAFFIAGGIVIFLIAVAALTIGIICISHS